MKMLAAIVAALALGRCDGRKCARRLSRRTAPVCPRTMPVSRRTIPVSWSTVLVSRSGPLSRRTVPGSAGSRGLHSGALPWFRGCEPLHGKMVHFRKRAGGTGAGLPSAGTAVCRGMSECRSVWLRQSIAILRTHSFASGCPNR